MTLTQLLIATGIGAFLTLVTMKFTGDTLALAKVTKDQNILEENRRLIRAGMDCQKTVANLPTPCPNNRRILFYNKFNKTTFPIQNGFMKADRYYMAATCTNTPRRFRVRATVASAGSTMPPGGSNSWPVVYGGQPATNPVLDCP